jgi:hypothetical protein
MSYYDGCGSSATPKQIAALRELLPREEHRQLYALSRRQAHEMLQARLEDWRRLPPTDRQLVRLRRHKLYRPGMNRGQASDAIAAFYGPLRPLGSWGGLGGGGTKCEPD